MYEYSKPKLINGMFMLDSIPIPTQLSVTMDGKEVRDS